MHPATDVVSRLRAAGCVFAEDEAGLLLDAAGSPADLEAMVGQRVAGAPLEYILGWVEFCGLRLAVEPGVFVPRRRTEFLVAQAVALAHPGGVALDLCCGCGAIGAALTAAVDRLELHVADLDPAAVRCAQRNVPRAHAYTGDLFGPLPATLRGHVDLLVANVPYVPTEAIALMPAEAREHEPIITLDGGSDGLDVARRVAAAAPQWLAPGGHVLIETSERQAALAADAFAASGLTTRVAVDDETESTVVIGTR